MIFLDSESPPLDNADFRRALSYSFPYEEVVNDILENRGAQSRGFIPPGLWGHDANVKQYYFDLDKAQEYLERSGVDPGERTFEFAIMAGVPEYRDLAQLWQVYLKQIGIDIEIRERNWDAHWENAKNPNPQSRQDIFIMIWWPDYASPIAWFYSLVHSEDEIFFNLAYIDNPEYDELINEANDLSVYDRDRAEALFKQVQADVIEQAYFILPYDRVEVVGVSTSIAGFNRSPAYPTAVQYFEITRVG
jgi:peptide/nickel transport system substrate-binding protein